MPRRFVYKPTRGPTYTPPEQPAGSGQLRIEQVKSEIGHPKTMRLTLRAMGIRHHQDVVVKQDSASLRGQIKKVRHLLKVTPVEE